MRKAVLILLAVSINTCIFAQDKTVVPRFGRYTTRDKDLGSFVLSLGSDAQDSGLIDIESEVIFKEDWSFQWWTDLNGDGTRQQSSEVTTGWFTAKEVNGSPIAIAENNGIVIGFWAVEGWPQFALIMGASRDEGWRFVIALERQ